jgi:hypothetical protein
MKPILSFSGLATTAGLKKVIAVVKDLSPFNTNVCCPFIASGAPRYSVDSRRIFSSERRVTVIFYRKDFTQIAKSVVRFVMVYVVNLHWPSASYVKPRKAMQAIFPPVKRCFRILESISFGLDKAPGIHSVPPAPSGHPSCKFPSLWVIVNEFFKAVVCDNAFSHWLTSIKSLVRGLVLLAPVPAHYTGGRRV